MQISICRPKPGRMYVYSAAASLSCLCTAVCQHDVCPAAPGRADVFSVTGSWKPDRHIETHSVPAGKNFSSWLWQAKYYMPVWILVFRYRPKLCRISGWLWQNKRLSLPVRGSINIMLAGCPQKNKSLPSVFRNMSGKRHPGRHIRLSSTSWEETLFPFSVTPENS